MKSRAYPNQNKTNAVPVYTVVFTIDMQLNNHMHTKNRFTVLQQSLTERNKKRDMIWILG